MLRTACAHGDIHIVHSLATHGDVSSMDTHDLLQLTDNVEIARILIQQGILKPHEPNQCIAKTVVVVLVLTIFWLLYYIMIFERTRYAI